jgi:hypothetical protein
MKIFNYDVGSMIRRVMVDGRRWAGRLRILEKKKAEKLNMKRILKQLRRGWQWLAGRLEYTSEQWFRERNG